MGHPETVRILLTGQASVEAAMRAVNEGRILRILMKPCREIELAYTIETALHSRERETAPLVARMLENVRLVQELDQANSVERATSNSIMLSDLIELMLDVGRIEAGQLPLTRTQVHVGELIEETQVEIGDLPERREKPDIYLEWEIGPSIHCLYTDREKLKLALKSLISNGLKFTDQGGVGVCITAYDNGVSFCIRDTGIGIAPNILPRIFEPFRQGDESTT